MKSIVPTRHTFLFRFVSTVIFSLVMLSTVAADEPDSGSGLGSIFTQVYNLFFGSVSVSSPADSIHTAARDTSCAWDPSCNPPPPSQ